MDVGPNGYTRKVGVVIPNEPQDIVTEAREDKPPYQQLFEPCAMDEHSDCIGYSNSLRRDGALVTCSCECHEDQS